MVIGLVTNIYAADMVIAHEDLPNFQLDYADHNKQEHDLGVLVIETAFAPRQPFQSGIQKTSKMTFRNLVNHSF